MIRNTTQDDPIDDGEMIFADEVSECGVVTSSQTWSILIVDDEKDVHGATRLALRSLVVEGRALTFEHAYSAAEARNILSESGERFAVVLLDVVMEEEDSGLRLVEYIRNELSLNAIRIILRTGQPGYAPELDTIKIYDINDYKTKSELTRVRLYTSLTVALRSYWQLNQLEGARKGLEKIIQASADLNRMTGLNEYSEGVVTQLCALLNVPAEGIVCAHTPGESVLSARIIAAAGSYATLINHPLSSLPNAQMRSSLEQSLKAREPATNTETCLYFEDSANRGVAICIESPKTLNYLDRELIKAFSSNLSVGFNNISLHEQVLDVAYFDQLLRVPNRNRFVDIIAERIVNCAGQVLALIDIDDFSEINAALDQHFGDKVLKAVCDRLLNLCTGDIAIGRVDGDCFGLIGDSNLLTPLLISVAIDPPYDIEGEQLRLSVTSGFIVLDDTVHSATELLKDASIALKQAKTLSRGTSMVFTKDLRTSARERMRLLTGLRAAFSSERLFVVFQPQIDMRTRRVLGAEVLLRWRNDQGEYISPDKFIPLAEKSGMIISIGNWVANEACIKLKEMMTMGYHDFRMAINVSHVQFREPDFVKNLEYVIGETMVPHKQIEVELTESIAPEGLEFINEKILSLHQLGVSVAMDDFGTGYSSLTMLSKLSIDRIKIDKSFVSELGERKQSCNIIEMIVALAKQLNMVTIAEGVETEAQHELLSRIGCTEGQGYLYSRPMSSADFTEYMRKGLGVVQ
jgi:diguanylate cyclase (GGDEF)-like protein